MNKVRKIVNEETFEWIRDIRRNIHQWPELAFKEEKTAELICRSLKKLGLKYQKGIAQTGVVGRLLIDEKAPTIALRADMDALPITEDTGLPFSSENQGVMHACGHDGHCAIILGAAAILKEKPPDGNVVFIFQPAEEGDGGAKPMIEEGVLEDVDMIFSGHIEKHFQVGEVGLKTGVHTAFTDAFDIRLIGRGGHAARPHETPDAVMIASRLVMDLQTIISREIDPIQPAVLTIGYFRSGTVYNAIADRAVLKGTIRSTDDTVREQIIERMKMITSSMSLLHNVEIKLTIKPGYPPVINDDTALEYAAYTAQKLLGKNRAVSLPFPSLGGEDFAYYLQKVPGCLVRFGGMKDGQERASSHSPKFDFDEETLRVGAAYMSELVRYAIKKLGKK